MPEPLSFPTEPHADDCRWCSHERVAHEHYRPGANCAHCGCKSYARRRRWGRR